ncbi:LOG family protein [Candidatus Woesearchaeota archaeon]|jgi:hypothetical protein|nr:LOG family protein [Candidatus Woesearchaeota archaeon]
MGVLKKELKKKDFRVTVFGSSRIKNNSKEYKQIYQIGELIGERGFDLVAGGGPGLMAAASKGHKSKRKDNSIHSIGLAIKLPKEQGVNKGVNVVKEFKHFSERLDGFMFLSNVFIVAPGGVGTLLELFYTWQLMQVNQICHVPIILLGEEWPSLVKWLKKYPFKNNYFNKKDLDLLYVAKNCDEVMKIVDEAHNHFKLGKKKFCLNYKKYKI